MAFMLLSPRALPPKKIVPPFPAVEKPPCKVKFPPFTFDGRQVGSRHFERIEEFDPSKTKSVFWLRTSTAPEFVMVLSVTGLLNALVPVNELFAFVVSRLGAETELAVSVPRTFALPT